ncbi:MAG: hypothetical protein MUO50_14065, partial [Longimicrobiales bacterium]|nr:hypothetical protein [Longimicrobiales bacterium]
MIRTGADDPVAPSAVDSVDLDPSQQSGPPGGPGRGGVRWLGCWVFRLGRGGREGCWERKARTGEWNGEGIILVGPFDDEGPQWSL